MTKNKQTSQASDLSEPETEEVKSAKPSVSDELESAEPTRILLSDTDAYVHDRLKGQPKNLKDVDIRVEEKRDQNVHRLSLPKEIKVHENKYRFRWIMKHKQAIDYACDVRGWVLVNRTYFNDLPRHLFTVSGSIERGDAILAFMPRKQAEEILKEPGDKSRDRIQSTFNKHADDPRYYKPSDKEDKNVIMI